MYQKKTQSTRFTVKDHQEAAALLGGLVGRLTTIRDLLASRYGKQHLLTRNGKAAVAAVSILRADLDNAAQQEFPGAGVTYPVQLNSTTPDPTLMQHAMATPSESDGID